MKPISEYLKENYLICDGAFGTYYAEKYNTKELPELANLSAPERVREIHEEYVSAGAKLIRTNTFAAHPDLLNCGQGLLAENVKSACRLAKEAADGKAYVAGDIGPVPAEAAFDTEAAEKHKQFSSRKKSRARHRADERTRRFHTRKRAFPRSVILSFPRILTLIHTI